jgi:hypothetical protein
VLDVGQEQLLVLLLVVDAELDSLREIRIRGVVRQQRIEALVHGAPVVADLASVGREISPRSARATLGPTES